jgi:hypothetical protein
MMMQEQMSHLDTNTGLILTRLLLNSEGWRGGFSHTQLDALCKRYRLWRPVEPLPPARYRHTLQSSGHSCQTPVVRAAWLQATL